MSVSLCAGNPQAQDQPLRVLHIFSGNMYGGVERMLQTLAECKSECPETETSFAYCFEGKLSAELGKRGESIYHLGEAHARWLPSVWRVRMALRRVLAKQDLDCVITHSPWGQGIFGPAIQKAGIPNILWLHDHPEGKHWVERWARFHPPDLVLCNSRFTMEAFNHLYPHAPADFLHPPVANDGKPLASDRQAIRSDLNLASDSVVLIQIGRMEPIKGHSFMLRSLSLLRDIPGWSCLIVGGAQREKETRYMQELSAEAVHYGIADRVRFLGERNDIPELLAASDIYVQGNIGPETFGIVFIEALYARLPVVTTDLGGAREIVTKDCGILVPPGDIDAYAAALRRIIQDAGLRHQLGSAGPDRAQTLCSPVRQTRRFHEVLSSLQETTCETT
jgi:glycosyltransferase involved in cell wall biosynthesis